MAISKYDKKFEYGKILTEGDLNGMVDAINLSIDGVNNADAKSETAIKEATAAKNAVKTLEGLANSTEAMETLAGLVMQIEENTSSIKMKASLQEVIESYPTNLFPRDGSTLMRGSYNDNKVFTANANEIGLLVNLKAGETLQFGYYLGKDNQGNYVNWYNYKPNQSVRVWDSNDVLYANIGTSNFTLPYTAEIDCSLYLRWYSPGWNSDPSGFPPCKYFGVLKITEVNPPEYSEYFKAYSTEVLDETIVIPQLNDYPTKEDVEKIPYASKTDIENTTKLRAIPSLYLKKISYDYKLNSGQYSTLSPFISKKEMRFASNGEVSEDAMIATRHRVVTFGDYIQCADKSIGTVRGGTLRLSFSHTGKKLEINYRSNQGFNASIYIREDGRWYRLCENTLHIPETSAGYLSNLMIEFEDSASRDFIVITNSLIYSIGYEEGDRCVPTKENTPIAVFAGSSITEASAQGNRPETGWVQIASVMLGMDAVNIGVGSRGITEPAGDRGSIIDNIDDILWYKDSASIVVVGGAINDNPSDLSVYQQEVEGLIARLKTEMPNALIVLLGSFTPQYEKIPTEDDILNKKEYYLRAAAANQNVPFISQWLCQSIVYKTVVKQDTQWMTGRFVSGSNELRIDGNCGILYYHENGSTDHTHPGTIGHRYIGGRMADALFEVMKYKS